MASIEERIEDWCKQQLETYYIKTQSVNSEIDEALSKFPSKQGGSGKNYPDIKCLIQTPDLRYIPVMIEVKGSKGALEKLDETQVYVENSKKDGSPNYQNIAKYAVNGAVHYANAILRNAPLYKEVVAVGVNGYERADGRLQYEVGVYYVSKDNLYVPKRVGDFDDLSFLQAKHQTDFIR